MSEKEGVWEDREVKFDIPNVHKKIRGGEKIYEILDHIEDTKGNPGDRGRLLVTNIRLIWYAINNSRFTLTIGYSNISTMNTKTVVSRLRGTTQALYILTVNNNSRFEFIFTNLTLTSRQNFGTVFDVYRLYQASPLYRELKLRGAIIQNGQLLVLPQEQVFNSIAGVYNLSSDQGNLGTFAISNIRIVWFADMNESFNISLPYMQVSNIKIRESKYGPALVIQTTDSGGSYVLGFRIDPPEKLTEVFKELSSLYSIYSEAPIFGVFYEQKQKNETKEDTFSASDFEEIDTKETAINSKFTAYLAEGSGTANKRRDVFFCKELGFAMEKLKDGYTLKDLWEVIPSSSNQYP
ncbi:Bardet-Biedl syndrome 5 protein homolog [Culicoides brevitarsis]|uniref:Bardet-Biedl syndrome 5 protein homolog n=1 Tax=Culicoides brevitarsis TaxID=469753 RepID=UPI00307C364C